MGTFRHAVATVFLVAACTADVRPLAAAWEELDGRCSEEAARLRVPLTTLREKLAAIPSETPGKRKVAEELLAIEASLRGFDTQLLSARNAAQAAISKKQTEVLEGLIKVVRPELEKGLQNLQESAKRLELHTARVEQEAREKQDADAKANALALEAEAARKVQLEQVAKHGGHVTLHDIRFVAGATDVSSEPETRASLRSLVAFSNTCATLTFDVWVHTTSSAGPARPGLKDQQLTLLRASFLHARLLQEGVRPGAVRRVEARPVQGEGFVTVQVVRRCP